ncbi:MAG: hypothetical protein ACM3O3_11690 [Syntrophothermus sp.]|nr:hypothetical protein [Ignavibacteriaceae bacterium]
MDDLSSLEAQVSVLKYNEAKFNKSVKSLEEQISALKRENMLLKEQIQLSESSDSSKFSEYEQLDIFGTLSNKEKDELKEKLQNLINKLEFHLSS